ncbi:E3 ubiquitin-protein ligase dbl4 {ECO:0000250/UniProtKB:P36113, ECO:0000305} {ECO:0000250/UniProtKB:P36113}; AltName: Full=DNA-break-localizing protein 4 {ECO:0000303/PubMed:23628481}; AltName: Full=Histone E3 ligase 1 {ECO:0000250/UniProtKB:P36113} [Serendipita indica DSM 11827]|uniref:RBR-type E3 ubiquitin transferase n=1 Tax=Serendipita indica (strain DSM 11827) TaxID=1109443 RepID=G4T524_SERID|nr:E3 ubiquitin-protein ligase dbl4 {ECO:0000250/UniProtKB:P36113, ECO:0000305} {ECO:0000250/UniProtKB:P36113}; AltName: Full=DNA-break-localizing protein 4 {ECO:0000303/PubMed:23628481}; AltName: Full=Histone E3 ligase 1 {ECO:0000250/UniProtKB:P36113} [Serendipita indica DSM 11827]CCA66370.1 probable ring-finger protein Ariadne-1 [Serendipita indica DSM 11827]
MSDSYDDDEYMEEEEEDLFEDEVMSDDDAAMDNEEGDYPVIPDKDKPKSYDVESKSLSVDDVQKDMRSQVEYVVSVFGLEPDTARMLLRDYGWNRERMTEQYMEDPSKVLIKAGIEPDATSPRSPIRSTSSQPPKESSFSFRRSTRKNPVPDPVTESKFMCPICCDDEPPSTLALACNHRFCSDCWSQYLEGKVRDEGECVVRCMKDGCSLLVPDSFIKEHSSAKTYDRFEELVLRHYVSHIAHLKFCPAPGCTDTVSCTAAATKSALDTVVPSVSCAHGHKFCFGCSIDADHRPVLCKVAKLWVKKCQDDSETANWIKTNTKECSKCQSTIEKNGGCNHMTCKKCKHEFCWVCMGPWSDHGTQWYSCNRYDDKAAIEARDAQSKSRISLERYLHYYNRWANHEQSAKLSAELYVKTEKKMEEMQLTTDLTWIEVQFAKKAVEEVLRCRATLKWTYAMAYYLDKSNEKELFEDNQRDLEKAVEDLSELLESPIEAETIPELRANMTNKTVYVQKRNEIMLEDTAQGFREGRWTWNVDLP